MKKILGLLLSVVFIFSFFTACGDETVKDVPNEPITEELTTEEPTSEEETSKEETEEPTSEEATDTIKGKTESLDVTGTFVPKEDERYFGPYNPDISNIIKFENGKAFVQINLYEGIASAWVDYEYNAAEGAIVLSEGVNDYDERLFNAGVKLYPDEYWENMTIEGMEEAFCLENWSCSPTFADGNVLEKHY